MYSFGVQINHKSEKFVAYIAALKAHKAKVAQGKRTNRAALWQKAEAARREMQAGPVLTQEELDQFNAMAERESRL